MATVALDCNSTEGILRIIKLMTPSCGLELEDDDICAIIEAYDSPSTAAYMVFTIMAGRASGAGTIRIGSTSITKADLSQSLSDLASKVAAEGLPGCDGDTLDDGGAPFWATGDHCDELFPGRFTNPRCHVCRSKRCTCGGH